MSLFSPSHLQDHEKTYMSISCSKLEFEIHIINDELLKTIWEHMREGERGGGERGEGLIIKLINLHLITINLTSFSHFQSEASAETMREHSQKFRAFSLIHGVLGCGSNGSC